MMKHQLLQQLINPSILSSAQYETAGLVTDTFENENKVTLLYQNKEGNLTEKENVPLHIYGEGTTWFPNVGDIVRIRISSDSALVIGKHTDNYDKDIRTTMEKSFDIYADFDTSVGIGTIL